MSTLNSYLIQFSVAVFCVLPPSVLFGQQATLPIEAVPDGWYVYPDSKLKNPDEATLRCFNYSRNEWQVSNDRGNIEIERRLEQASGVTSLPSLPPSLKLEQGMPGRTVTAGLRTAIRYQNGWLIAYDAGEWGGGLWLTNEDGSKTKRIIDSNVRAVMPFDDGILVLSGLAHMGTDFGNAFIFSNPNGLEMPLQRTMWLDGEPSAPAIASDGAVFFVTTYGLCKITRTGELQRLISFPKWTRQQYPNSMAISPDGTIFIGMRMFVLRLRATPAGYSEDWLLPNDCRKFELRGLDCVCEP